MRSLKKTVLFVALSMGALITSCNKKVDTTNQEKTPSEETATKFVDSIQTDTVAPVEAQMDSIRKK